MSKSTSERTIGAVMLLVTSLIWGCAFVAQSVAMDHVGPFTFVASRFAISGAVLLLFLVLRRGTALDGERRFGEGQRRSRFRSGVTGGVVCGLFLCTACLFQQVGVKYTTSAKAGFLTAVYIILVPLYGFFLGRRPRRIVALAAAIAMFGMYLLCMEGSFRLEKGDFLCLLCAATFPLQILSVEYFVQNADPIVISCTQFLVSAIISAPLALLLEHPTADALRGALLPILYAGLLSSAVGYTLQIVGQKLMQNPSAASLIMSLESVFAALAGWVLLQEALSPRKILGCVIMFAAIILAQI